MGFKTTEWAYRVTLPPVQKSVLVALAHSHNEKTGLYMPGQDRLADMTGNSVRSVSRALIVLDELGLIIRTKRFRKGGERTSDSYSFNLGHQTEGPQVAVTTGQSDHQSESPTPPDTLTETTRHSVRAIEQEEEQEEEQEVKALVHLPIEPLIPFLGFDDFWKLWPRKDGRKAALTAWATAIKRTDANTIVAAASAYANNPHIPDRQYIPHGSTWLRGDRWDDPLPEAPAPACSNRQMPADRMRATLALVQNQPQRGISS